MSGLSKDQFAEMMIEYMKDQTDRDQVEEKTDLDLQFVTRNEMETQILNDLIHMKKNSPEFQEKMMLSEYEDGITWANYGPESM